MITDMRLTKGDVMNWMRDNDVDVIEATFDGSGDEGWVDQLLAYNDSGASVELNDGQETEALSLVYDILENVLSGWEINEGSFGTVKFVRSEDSIIVDFNERFESSEYTEYKF